MDEAIKHCTYGLGIWEWASNDRGAEPDVVMACCGDIPTMETLAAVDFYGNTCLISRFGCQHRGSDGSPAQERTSARYH